VRCALAETPGCSIPVSASVGVACLEPGETLLAPGQLLERCESALTSASHQGGNRVVAHGTAADTRVLA
jgi:PleD family two-component response regulator